VSSSSSSTVPDITLIYMYSDSCTLCQHVAPSIRQVATRINQLIPASSLRFLTLHCDFESSVVRKLPIRHIPAIYAQIHYNQRITSRTYSLTPQQQHLQLPTASSIMRWISDIYT